MQIPTPETNALYSTLRAALLLFLGVFGVLLFWIFSAPKSAENETPRWYGDQFIARGFAATPIGRMLPLVTREANTQRSPAIAVVEGLSIPTAQFGAISLVFAERERAHRVAFIWRTDVAPNTTQRVELASGTNQKEFVHLSEHPGWKGNVIGVGIAAGHPNAVPLSLIKLEASADTATSRAAKILGAIQTTLGRPTPGQETQSHSTRIWLLSVLLAGICAATTLILFFVRRSLFGRHPLALALCFICVCMVAAESSRKLDSDIQGNFDSAPKVRTSTLIAIGEALKNTDKDATLHVWSGDGRGHEIALAIAPRRARVRLLSQTLENATAIKQGDVILVLGRRGVRFIPRFNQMEWDVGGAIQQRMVDVIAVQGGDVLVKVRQ